MKRYIYGLISAVLWGCLTVSGFADTIPPGAGAQATGITAVHQQGQTFVTWQEVTRIIPTDTLTGKEFHTLLEAEKQKISYHVYAASGPIQTLEGMAPIATVPSLSGWNRSAYGIDTRLSEKPMHRYVITEGAAPLSNGTGLWVHNPDQAGSTYYAVTVSIDGIENRTLGPFNSMAVPLPETVGPGKPVLQRVEKPASFMGAPNPTLHYYTRWEAPPNTNREGKAYDYLVGIPEKLAVPAPVGIHMHCWGGSQESGYTWWNDAEDGAILLASNQDPYDWWTGYQERLFTPQTPKTPWDWKTGVVRPYTSNRLFSFFYWMQADTAWQIDPYRTFTAGSSMGGSGSIMTGIRNGGRIAWVRSCVGVHVPGETTTMKSPYAAVFGAPEHGVLFENGIPVWNWYDDVWFLRSYPAQETPFITFSNAKNDPLIDWPQAVHFYQALQDTKRPHLFVWGQDGHDQMALMPLNGSQQTMPIDIRVNQSLPAFTRCSLDDVPGSGDPADGAPQGQVNGYLYWETADIVDNADRWEITVGLTESAPQADCTVDITARRLQAFKPVNGWPVTWENRDLATGALIASGTLRSDANGLLTLPQITVSKDRNRIILKK